MGTTPEFHPAPGVVVTRRYNQYGVEIKIDSRMNDGKNVGSSSARGVERYVTALAVDHTEPMRVDESTLGTVKLVAFLPWRSESYASTSSSFSTWRDSDGTAKEAFIPGINKVLMIHVAQYRRE